MTVLRLVTVGAFLLSIVMADNGNSMRRNSQPFGSSQPLQNPIHRDLFYPHDTSHPWSSQRIVHDGPVFDPTLDVPDSIASASSHESQYIQRVPKPVNSNNEMMILEPMQKHQKSSWSDWMPDFFGDDSPPGPGPLIGPLEFPGIGKKVFIRQNEPLDEDTNRVVIHLINRETPHTYSPPVTQSHLPQQYNHLPFYMEDPIKQHDGYVTPGKSSVIQHDEYPSKIVNGDSWKISETSPEKDNKDKKSGYPAHDRLLEVQNDPNYSTIFLKQSGSNVPNVIWNQRPHYGRSLNPTESKGPVTFPSTNNASSPSDSQSKLQQSNASQQKYETLRRYGYQNNTVVSSETRPQAEIPRFKQPVNYLDEITLVNKAELNRRRGSPIRTPRNQYSVTRHFVRSSSPFRQRLPESVSGGIRVIPAPNLQRGPVTNSTGEDVMHNIMSMTASQSWKNVTSAKMMDEKKTTIERRIDIEEETKEELPSESVPTTAAPVTPANKNEMKEAVRKMMGSFSLWRHKVVTTQFLKELEEKQKHKKTRGRKKSEADKESWTIRTPE